VVRESTAVPHGTAIARRAARAGSKGRFVGVHVTEDACQALSELLGRRGGEKCLRLSTTQGNYRFILDEPIEQDITFQHEERTVLVVSETVSRDLWGITVDCSSEEGKRKLIFRKAKAGEPLDTTRDETDTVPPEWRASEHERLLQEIAEIGKQIASLRGATKNSLREQLHVLEAQKQEKWDAIRTLWAGDGGWHRRQNGNGVAAKAD
jgi:Fe-S cluster assembly iron-binding protein IscA